jgi:hypothetical protein
MVFAIRQNAFLHSGLLNSRHVPLTKPRFIRKRFVRRVMTAEDIWNTPRPQQPRLLTRYSRCGDANLYIYAEEDTR